MRFRHGILLLSSVFVACSGSGGENRRDDAGADDAGPNYPSTPREGVDVFAGTGGLGYGVGSALPGATTPFSLVKLSPDTSAIDGSVIQFAHCGGYAYDDPKIIGFSHTHMHGIGVPAYGNVLFMPTVGMVPEKIEARGYRSTYDKQSERGAPGYYAVRLDEHDILVELSAGVRTGYHRVTWPAGTPTGDAVIVIDLGEALAQADILAGHIEIRAAERRVRGWTRADGMLGGVQQVYFDAVFDHALVDYGAWRDGALALGSDTGDGTMVGGFVAFDVSDGRPVGAEVGISYVDMDGAFANREGEAVPGFDEAVARAESAWDRTLGLIEVEGGTAREQRIFYSALYHVYQHPTLFTDADGSYRGFDDQVHNDARDYYSDFSLWDTYRTLHSLLILLSPDASADMAQSLVRMYEQMGGLPRWPLGTSDSGSMIGTSADVVLAETWLKGATNFDIDTAWQAMVEHAEGPAPSGRDGIAEYIALGYVAADLNGGSVAKTMEYAWDDFAMANLAEARGMTAEAQTYRDRSRTIDALWDATTGFFRGRNADGTWDPAFSETDWEDYYVEGNAWQYLWLTPYDDILATLMGGQGALIARLDEFFALSADHWSTNMVGRLAPLPYYWHGNEPDLHVAYLFAAAGEPAKAQQWVRWIMAEHYDLGPEGLAGNDDAGTLSAWYVFSALGIYPLAGSDRYFIGTPAFDRAVLHLPGGDFVIEADARADGPYVQWVELDGVAHDSPWLTHADLVNGGTLRFGMGASPSTWATR